MKLASQFSAPLILTFPAFTSQAQSIAKQLNISCYTLKCQTFANSETLIIPPVTVRGKTVLLFHSTIAPVNENLFQLLIAVDAIKRAAAHKVILIAPFLGYGRQEKNFSGRDPITAQLVAKLLKSAGVEHIITLDVHNSAISGFYDIPFENWSVFSFLLIHALQSGIQNYVLGVPDQSRVKNVHQLANLLQVPLIVCAKSRPAFNSAKTHYLQGDVRNRNVIFLDDMLDTGGTVLGAARLAKQQGAKAIYILATHGLFSGDALKHLARSHQQGILTKIWVSDSIPVSSMKINDNAMKTGAFLKTVALTDFFSKLLRLYLACGCLSEYWHQEKEHLQKFSHG